MIKPLTGPEKRAMAFLKKGPMTPVMLADQMWDTRRRAHQCYALPAGRILHRLKNKNMVDHYWDRAMDRGAWQLTTKGKEFASRAITVIGFDPAQPGSDRSVRVKFKNGKIVKEELDVEG